MWMITTGNRNRTASRINILAQYSTARDDRTGPLQVWRWAVRHGLLAVFIGVEQRPRRRGPCVRYNETWQSSKGGRQLTTATKEPKQRDKPRRTAFISAPVSTNTGGIRQILQHQGIDAFTADQILPPGGRLSDILQHAIANADVVLAIFDSGVNSNVFFELGFAQALKKRTLILVDADVDPPFIADVGVTFLRTKLDNTQAIEVGISQVLNAPLHGTSAAFPGSLETRDLLGTLFDRLDESESFLLGWILAKGERHGEQGLRSPCDRQERRLGNTSVESHPRESKDETDERHRESYGRAPGRHLGERSPDSRDEARSR